MAGKYAALGAHLRAQSSREVPMSFAEIERVIGDRLPPSARRHRPWWSNNATNSVVTKAWLDAGFKTEAVDLEHETLVFQRSTAGEKAADLDDFATTCRHPAFGALKGMVTIMPGTDLTAPADPDWGKVYDD